VGAEECRRGRGVGGERVKGIERRGGRGGGEKLGIKGSGGEEREG